MKSSTFFFGLASAQGGGNKQVNSSCHHKPLSLATCVHSCSVTAAQNPPYMLPRENCGHWSADLAHTTRPPASYSHLEISSIKPLLTAMWAGVCGLCHPSRTVAPGRWAGDTHTQKESWMGLGQLAVPPPSACSQQPWEALAKGAGRTMLTHGEKTGGNCPSSSNYPRQIKTQDMEA